MNLVVYPACTFCGLYSYVGGRAKGMLLVFKWMCWELVLSVVWGHTFSLPHIKRKSNTLLAGGVWSC